MGKDSKIEWTDHTFNPWIGCTKVSEGCENCYAERLMDKRLGRVEWGPSGTRSRTSESYWQAPYRWDREAAGSNERVKVFCASLSDVFEDRPELGPWRLDLWDLIEETANLTWMLLTKRPQNVLDFVPELWKHGYWPAHVWLGVSAGTQDEADTNIPVLLRTPAAVRFVSAEPLLGPIDFSYWLLSCPECGERPKVDAEGRWRVQDFMEWGHYHGYPIGHLATECNPALDWLICGGESGSNARPMHPRWARLVRNQCQETETPFHFKQWGEWAPCYEVTEGWWCLSEADGNEIRTRIPNDTLIVRNEWDDSQMARVGKKRAGRLFDGREWNEMPKREASERGGPG
jgi:protein gp37